MEGNKRKVRWMEKNQSWAIPFNSAFVIKTIEDFRPSHGVLSVQLTLILRIKFTALPNIQYIMNFCAGAKEVDNYSEMYRGKIFQCRINEEETAIIDEAAGRPGRV